MADRSDTESPVGPVKECVNGEPLHGYVNLPQDQEQDEEEVTKPPLLVAKKERSR